MNRDEVNEVYRDVHLPGPDLISRAKIREAVVQAEPDGVQAGYVNRSAVLQLIEEADAVQIVVTLDYQDLAAVDEKLG